MQETKLWWPMYDKKKNNIVYRIDNTKITTNRVYSSPSYARLLTNGKIYSIFFVRVVVRMRILV